MAQVPERKQSCVPAAQKAKYEENCQDNSYDGPGYDAYNGRGFSIHGYLLSQLKSCPDNRLYSRSDQKYDPGYIPAHSAEAYDKIQNSNKTRAKFEKVGVSVKNLGGDMNNSDAGFMEDKNIHTAGKSAARQQIARNTQAQRIPTASSGFILECILDCICFMNPCPSLSHICCTIAQSPQSLQTIQKPQRLLFQNYNF